MAAFNFERELRAFKRAITGSKFQGITWGQVGKELFINGVSALITLVVSQVLGKFFAVRSFRNLWGLAARKRDKVLINKDTYEWLNIVLIFIIGLFVFSIIEQVLHRYFEEREKDL
ncbi:MAG TPA: hypothetical protein VL947_05650 [Cytophagales bacterium]|nr:hypothetical protein [Cytophagales bacterium]